MLIVMTEIVTLESVMPAFTAIAFTVVVADTVNGAVNTVPVDAVGVEPSVV
ncbi:hypothetical protein D3C84_1115540 [compost metagenome]